MCVCNKPIWFIKSTEPQPKPTEWECFINSLISILLSVLLFFASVATTRMGVGKNELSNSTILDQSTWLSEISESWELIYSSKKATSLTAYKTP